MPARQFDKELPAGSVNSRMNNMKRRYTTSGIIFGLLSVLNTGAYAAYQEEWLSPQALKKEEAARASSHTSAHVCKSADSHCASVRPKSAAAKPRSEIRGRPAGRSADPIADFAKKGNAARPARVAAR
ncbi:hypothetical protein FVF58_36585 [Paraburkholderia panacisoli]|uniref:Uncharacterized protein n=1 Tax=Paraburkholderia panacisoli TaxID=2603818 RepID=A0A5B0GJH2_9BURK|nr:hypothetical protein [Paraburkholderia panacisoli]KAA1003564.1 hypothetical protein FVF58_36585 [Paraburkholderia panacisoli]